MPSLPPNRLWGFVQLQSQLWAQGNGSSWSCLGACVALSLKNCDKSDTREPLFHCPFSCDVPELTQQYALIPRHMPADLQAHHALSTHFLLLAPGSLNALGTWLYISRGWHCAGQCWQMAHLPQRSTLEHHHRTAHLRRLPLCNSECYLHCVETPWLVLELLWLLQPIWGMNQQGDLSSSVNWPLR